MNKVLAIIISMLLQCVVSYITYMLFTNSTDSKFIIAYIGGAFAIIIAQIWNVPNMRLVEIVDML